MSRIDAFSTTPVTNVIQHDRVLWQVYLKGMNACYTEAVRQRSRTPVKEAQAVLGKQDYCWTGSSRHWVWERTFIVDYGQGRTTAWRWRLLVSKRGFTLEVEDRYTHVFGEAIRVAGRVAVEHFLKTWQEAIDGR